MDELGIGNEAEWTNGRFFEIFYFFFKGEASRDVTLWTTLATRPVASSGFHARPSLWTDCSTWALFGRSKNICECHLPKRNDPWLQIEADFLRGMDDRSSFCKSFHGRLQFKSARKVSRK
jgi:hypothetical protein